MNYFPKSCSYFFYSGKMLLQSVKFMHGSPYNIKINVIQTCTRVIIFAVYSMSSHPFSCILLNSHFTFCTNVLETSHATVALSSDLWTEMRHFSSSKPQLTNPNTSFIINSHLKLFSCLTMEFVTFYLRFNLCHVLSYCLH